MKVTLAVVASLDGFTTYGSEPGTAWASAEDQEYFQSLKKRAKVVIMGSNTYSHARESMNLTPDILRVVMTREVSKFREQTVAGQLEFTSESPVELLTRLESMDYTEVLLVSGESLTTQFFNEKLINEVHCTTEPFILGSGKGFVRKLPAMVKLELIDSRKVNKIGTFISVYKVLS